MKNKNITLREWLLEKDFSLALSSSFFGFFAHCGIVTALFECGISPKKLTGSSAGALVAAALASGKSPDEMKKLFFSIKKKDFWDPNLGFGLLKGEKFLDLLNANLCEKFEHTKIPVEIAVLDLFSAKTKFLSKGDLPKSVLASCSVPLLFPPVKLNGRLYLDGGIFHKSGISLKHKNERIFCAFILNPGLMGLYEKSTSFSGLGEEQKVLQFSDLPVLGPNKLHQGEDVFFAAYKSTKASLALPVDQKFLLKAKT